METDKPKQEEGIEAEIECSGEMVRTASQSPTSYECESPGMGGIALLPWHKMNKALSWCIYQNRMNHSQDLPIPA